MFGKDEKRDDFDITGFIGKGMKVEGKITFDKTVRIDGSFKGEIEASGGTLVIGEGAFVEADIKVDTAIVTGEVKGTLDATTRVELQAPAKIFGELRTPSLIMGEGTVFDGNCVMLKGGSREPLFTESFDSEAKKKDLI